MIIEPIEFKGKIYMCPCMDGQETAEYEREKKQKEFEEYESNLNLALTFAFPYESMRNYNFGNDDKSAPEITDLLMKYCKDFKYNCSHGLGLCLWGGVGTGKTFYACEIINYLVRKNYKAKLVNFPYIIDKYSNFDYGVEFIDHIIEQLDLLVIDDFGVERQTDFAMEKIYNFVNKVYEKKIPVILTTNLVPSQLVSDNIAYQRVLSRLLSRCLKIKVNKVNHRKMQEKDNLAEMKKRLGL